MSADWGRGWRKLYKHPSQEWLALPLSVRGMGDELIRVADDEGRVFVGHDVLGGLMRALDAHSNERRRVRSDWKRLQDDGFARAADGYVTVRNFVLAQGAVSPSAHRMRRLRSEAQARLSSDRPTTDPRPTHDRPTTDPRPSYSVTSRNYSVESVTVTPPIDQIRSEEIRSAAAQHAPLPPNPPAQRPQEPAPPPRVISDPPRSQNPESAQRGSAAISSIPQAQSPALENGYELALRLRDSAGPRMACVVSPTQAELLERVVRGLIAQGQGLDLFDVLGAYIKAGALRWMQQREPSLGYLLERDGAVFVQYLNSAREWDAVGRPALDSKGNRVVRTANNPNGGARREEPKPQNPPPATEAELAEARARWAEMKRLKREVNNAS